MYGALQMFTGQIIQTTQHAFKAGWVYRTRVEAEAALPKVAAEFDVKYRL